VGLRSLRARASVERLAAENTEALRRAAAVSDLRNRQMAISADMLHALECVVTVEEGLLIVSTFCKKLVPGVSGSLYLYRNSRDVQAKHDGRNRVVTAGRRESAETAA
jgi:hypothetical protein